MQIQPQKLKNLCLVLLWAGLLNGPFLPSTDAKAQSPSQVRRPAQALPSKVFRLKPGRIIEPQLLISQGDFSDRKPSELRSMLKGFQTLVRIEKDAEKKTKLLLSEANTWLALSRTMSNARQRKVPHTQVLKILSPIVETPASDHHTANDQKSLASYYMGLAALNLSMDAKAEQFFRKAIELDPSAKYNQALSLFLAEQAFEKDKYQEALDIFKTHLPKYNESQRTLAHYKMAWCYVGLGQNTEAEKYFLMIAGKDAAGPFGTDGLKDLAHIVPLNRNSIEASARSPGSLQRANHSPPFTKSNRTSTVAKSCRNIAKDSVAAADENI